MLESLFALGFVDILDPSAISAYVFILSMVKKRWHALLYIVGAYSCYLVCSAALYLGVEKVLLKLITDFISANPTATGIILLVLAIACVVGLLFSLRYMLQVIRKEKEFSMDAMLSIKSLHPMFILAFGMGYSLCSMPFCYPIMTYMGILAANGYTFLRALPYLAIFCMTSQLPLFLIHYLSVKLDGPKMEKVLGSIRRIMGVLCAAAIPILLLIACWWLFGEAFRILL
ncbi:MAG: GAP family protein [Christensenellaceae bacterium]|nr:GAP family protein [Christensenellaceae bacterium]